MIKLYFALSILIGTYASGLIRNLLLAFNNGGVTSTITTQFNAYSNLLYILAFVFSVIIFKQIVKSYDLNIKNKRCITLKLGVGLFCLHLILKIVAMTPLMYVVFRLEFLKHYFTYSYLPAKIALILVIIGLFRVLLEATPKLSKT